VGDVVVCIDAATATVCDDLFLPVLTDHIVIEGKGRARLPSRALPAHASRSSAARASQCVAIILHYADRMP
jgi:hypothetical protein